MNGGVWPGASSSNARGMFASALLKLVLCSLISPAARQLQPR